MSYIAVIGAGSWGTTLACLLSDKGYDVSLWVHDATLSQKIKETRINSVYLPDIIIPDNTMVTNNIEEALKRARYILNAVPAQYVRTVFSEGLPYMLDEALIVSLSKGIERKTLLTVSSILKELSDRPVAVLSGPSFAKEVIKKLPSAVTLAMDEKNSAYLLQEVFNLSNFRVYTHDDIIGVEIGGALKNVMAIAAGISDSLGLGNNARASLITRGLAEMTRLGVAMGARERTFSGLSGMGDLVLTCTSILSRNYTVGMQLGQGMNIKDILEKTQFVAEGVTTAESAFELAKKFNVDMPIVEQVYSVIYKNMDPLQAVRNLMERSLKTEFYG
jgi:glycerol-3-phosphate dehydrogenase (NAD(P)+)